MLPAVEPRLDSNLQSSCLILLSTGYVSLYLANILKLMTNFFFFGSHLDPAALP